MHFLLNLYDSLSLDNPIQPADLIFVLAGRMERKRYGLDLYRAGLAPRLLLSIGRFEVSKMNSLGLPGVQGLKTLRDCTQPEDRHFFLEMNAEGVSIKNASLPVWNTYGEAVGLRQLLEQNTAHKVMVLSTDVHLRRVAFTFGKIFRDLPVEFFYCAVPRGWERLNRDGWWTRRAERRFVLNEALKLAGYHLILLLPGPFAERIMGAGNRRSRT